VLRVYKERQVLRAWMASEERRVLRAWMAQLALKAQEVTLEHRAQLDNRALEEKLVLRAWMV
jgi:hypothetical protein